MRRIRNVRLSIFVFVLFALTLYVFHRKDQKKVLETSKIIKATVAVNNLSKNDAISRCLKSHEVQNELYGYYHHILQRSATLVEDLEDPLKRPGGIWTKPAYLLQILLSELIKPEVERAEWIFWFDADTLILNPHIRLETFVPPGDITDVHLIIGHNWDGINDGAFLIRVHAWSISLLTAHLSFPSYHPDDYLPMREQSALSYVLHAIPRFTSQWVAVPPRWFNSFPVNGTYSAEVHQRAITDNLFDDGESFPDASPWKVVKGDMLVHFAGFFRHRDSWIPPWADRAEQYNEEWSSPKYQQSLDAEVQRFWQKWKADRPKFESVVNEQTYYENAADDWKEIYEKNLLRNSDFRKYEVHGGVLD